MKIIKYLFPFVKIKEEGTLKRLTQRPSYSSMLEMATM